MKQIIAIIASSHRHFCESFLNMHGLNPKMFKIVTRYPELQGLPKDTPVILTHYHSSSEYDHLLEVIEHRFKNIRRMGY